MRALALALGLLCAPALAYAQGVGIFVRASCSLINNPVVGSTQCWDSTYNQLRSWNGVSWVAVGFMPAPASGGTIATLTIDPTGAMTIPSTLNIGSATAMNGQFTIVASASGPNLQKIVGLSHTGVAARNLRGTCTFAAAVTCAVAFANNEPDATYFVATGCPVTVGSKTASGFTMTATGTSSNACDYVVIR